MDKKESKSGGNTSQVKDQQNNVSMNHYLSHNHHMLCGNVMNYQEHDSSHWVLQIYRRETTCTNISKDLLRSSIKQS